MHDTCVQRIMLDVCVYVCFREQCIKLDNAAYCSEALSQPDLVTAIGDLKQSLSKVTQTGEYLTCT